MHHDEFDEHLQAALITRPAIEQAKGILANALCITPDQAFDELSRVSQDHNVKLNALAGALVETATGGRSSDAQLRKVIWQEWRDSLPSC